MFSPTVCFWCKADAWYSVFDTFMGENVMVCNDHVNLPMEVPAYASPSSEEVEVQPLH